MRKIIIVAILMSLPYVSALAGQYDRGYETVPATKFVKKGSWMAGGTMRYSQHLNENYNFLVISDINSRGYNFSVNPKGIYMLKDNMGVGLSLSYDRGMLDLSSADLAVANIEMAARDCYQIHHKYSAYGVFRAYIPFRGVKRLALFADLMLGGSMKQGKAYNGGGTSILGSYTQSYSLSLAVDPGIVAFLTENIALEVNVGIFGVNYRWNSQIHNQVSNGHFDSTSAGFMINLLSVGVGISYYFHK